MKFLVYLLTGLIPTFSSEHRRLQFNNELSRPTMLSFGVPQRSVPGPILFILYTKPLTTLIRQHFISDLSFADDTQLHDSYRPKQIDVSVQSMQGCISEVQSSMTANELKTESYAYRIKQNFSSRSTSDFHLYR